MLSCQLANERQPRSRNGQPAHSTTGVASTASRHCAQVTDIRCGKPDIAASLSTAAPRSRKRTPSPIASHNTGIDSASAIQKRRVMSTSSGFSSSAVVGMTRSSAIPQMGQLPGPARRISGCIGQVYVALSAAVDPAAAGCCACVAWAA